MSDKLQDHSSNTTPGQSDRLSSGYGLDQTDGLIKDACILMIDDEPINMEVLKVHLQEEGYKNFECCSDSRRAFEVICEIRPQILLLDLMMPDVDGFTLLQQIREHPPIAQLPVIVLTSSNDAETKLRALRLGANDFLAKPVDSSELALRLRNTLAAQAYHMQMTMFDTLTAIPNKRFLSTFLANVLPRLDSLEQRAALIMLDLNRFKNINDSLGRDAGDYLYKHYVKRVIEAFYAVDRPTLNAEFDLNSSYIFRMSGVKLLVVIPRVGKPEGCLDNLKNLLDDMRKPLLYRGEDCYLSVSSGISIFPDDGQSEDTLITAAETAMTQAKKLSDNRYAFYSEKMNEQAEVLFDIENGLKSALENDEFFLVYQPKVSIKTGRIVGAEALIRWKHPKYGLVAPDHFISLAEENGDIIPIGRWVLETACFQAVDWRNRYGENFKVAVNVSMRQLNEDDFHECVRSALESSGLPAQALTLELTENLLMDNAEENVARLNALKELGVSLSIDDFGTGYSSLSYLEKFPLDELKIDKSFIGGITSPLDRVPIVRAIALLSHELDLRVVVEGVETHHQLAHVIALKCEEYQGYLCSSPALVSVFEELLKQYNQKAA